MGRKIIFWGSAYDERLTHTEMHDAVESMLDGVGDINDLPETIEVCGYACMEPNMKQEATNVLERMLEGLDEEYGNPDGDSTEATDAMKEAALLFVKTVLEEYVSWVCEIVKRENVDTRKWIQENRPDWLENKDKG